MNTEENACWLESIIPAALEVQELGDWRVATGMLDEERSFAVSMNFSDVDTGLVLQDDPETEVRCELIAVTGGDKAEAAAVIVGAADMLREAHGLVPAQPGTLLPELTERSALKDVSVRHGMLTTPSLWGSQVPHLRDDRRITLVAELAMLTDDEYSVAVEGGMPKLATRLRRRGVDIANWRRD